MPASALVIYGSQTGQSEAISEQLVLEGNERGLDLDLACGDQPGLVDKVYLENQVVVFVVSSTGQGDPPENFEQFWSDLNERTPSGLRFTLLGLGDTNYTEYGGFPNKLHQYLIDSGAKNFYRYKLADDAIGLEQVVEPWIAGLWDALKLCLANLKMAKCSLNESNKQLQLDPGTLAKLASLELHSARSKTKLFYQLQFSDRTFSMEFPHGVEHFILPFAEGKLEKTEILQKNFLTNKEDDVKETIELELSTNISFGPGDSFGILCENSDAEVEELLDRIKLTAKQHNEYTVTADPSVKVRLLPKHVLTKCSARYALKYTLDLHSLPKKALLKYLSECCSDQQESDYLFLLSSKEGSSELNDAIYNPGLTLLEILSLVPSCVPSLSGLLQFLPRLTPRYYSVSRFTQGTVKFVFSQISNIRNSYPAVAGVCSSWLHSLSPGHQVFIYRRKNEAFKPVQGRSMVMVGAGTGVAPFLGFLDHVAEITAPGDSRPHTCLITGNRFKLKDSLYSREFAAHKAMGTLTSHKCAYSRDATSDCRYVQDILKRDAHDMVALLDTGAAVYVCGDAKGLGVGVFQTFTAILSEQKGITLEEAEKLLVDMKKSRHYCEDIWT